MSTRKKKKTARTKLTLKQTKFIKYYFETSGNGTQAAKLAGYKGNEDTLKVVASENLTKHYIKDAINKLYQRNGLSDEKLLEKHIELLNAERHFVSGEDIAKSPDSTVRLGALKLAYELQGKLTKKVDYTVKEFLYEDLNDKTPEELMEMANVLKSRRNKGSAN